MFLFFCAKSSEDNEAFIVNLVKMNKFRCHYFNIFLVCKLVDFSFQVVELYDDKKLHNIPEKQQFMTLYFFCSDCCGNYSILV